MKVEIKKFIIVYKLSLLKISLLIGFSMFNDSNVIGLIYFIRYKKTLHNYITIKTIDKILKSILNIILEYL